MSQDEKYKERLKLAVNEMSLRQIEMRRMANLGMGLDAKRGSVWCEYGYPNKVDESDLMRLYRRAGIAHGLVNRVAGTIWSTYPWLVEGSEQGETREYTAWEKSIAVSLPRDTWRMFRDADLWRLAGKRSAMILHVGDGKQLKSAVTGKRALKKITPIWGSAIKVTERETSLSSPRYGLPTMIEYRSDKNEAVEVHWHRVFFLGDWRSKDTIGFLEPAYNNFINLEKVEGGSGESFFKNAARQLSVNYDMEADFQRMADSYGVKVSDLMKMFDDQAKDLNKGLDAMIVTQGATVSPLVANVPDPRPTYDINVSTIAASTQTPIKIIIGMQTGERASTEDQKDFNAVNQSRREDRKFEIAEFIEHLMLIKCVEPAQFTVMWDDLRESTKGDKLASAKTMAEINTASANAGLGEVFTGEEIRVAAGYEAIDDQAPMPDSEPDGEE